MVTQPARFSMVRHLSGELFEVQVINGTSSTVYQTQPAMNRCTCEEPNCPHLADTNAFLHDHHCPYCLAYSPFGVLCGPCYIDLEAERFARADGAA